MPAYAGIRFCAPRTDCMKWIPAYAEMTIGTSCVQGIASVDQEPRNALLRLLSQRIAREALSLTTPATVRRPCLLKKGNSVKGFRKPR
jgi:hypothetical protein